MAVIVGSARIDERGKAHGGKAGDQTGKEVSTQSWYLHSKGWRVLRPIDPGKAAKIAECMRAACANNHIGYDQYQRGTLYKAAQKVGFDCARVTDKCETDCSALVRVCMAYAGIPCGDFTTANQVKRMLATGEFVEMADAKYANRAGFLRAGDVLVTKTQGHTVVVLTDGDKAAADPEGTPTGELGERTLKQGMVGPDVLDLQERLLTLGCELPRYGADGEFGAETLAAVQAFQRDHRLDADGIAGPDTIDTLLAACAEEPDEPGGEPAPDDQVSHDPDAGEGKVYPVRGVIPDVSKYQKNIDWAKTASAVDFVIIRVQDNTVLDGKLARNVEGAKLHEVPYALYAYFRAGNAAEAVTEAVAKV